MQARPYELRSVWHVPASRQECWDVLGDPRMTWPRWWPRVEALDVRPAADGATGSRARLRFRSPVGYALVLDLRVGDADAPRRVVVHADGDLHGRADVRLTEPAPGTTRVEIAWRVRTTRRWMNALGPVAAPLFALAHAAMMRAGERGLRRYLRTVRESPASGPTSRRA
ncbi:SRPBCC family protein [Cellulomonas telluris]|uniref:SRPBCC family protein n=1 Tax=Cellulomonas telluris TaxID=2306636 RepID=UPI0010A8D5C6|nr:SRPBCC family protein [Cellulomonas telluris]